MLQPIPAIDELIMHFIQSPQDPALQASVAELVANSPEHARYIESRLQAWLMKDIEPAALTTLTVKQASRPSVLHAIRPWMLGAVGVVMAVVLFCCFRKTPRKLRAYTNSATHIDSVRLPDGSRIVLNKNAAILYDKNHQDHNYAEVMKGDVFFDLRKQTPCTVVTPGDYTLNAAAAAFNVHVSATGAVVFVSRGKVTLSGKAADDMVLPANTLVTLEEKKATRKKLASQAPLAWKTGMLRFHNIEASEILDAVSVCYAIQISVPPSAEKLLHKKLTIDLRKKSEREMISLLQKSLSAHLAKDSTDRYYLTLK
ncbi:FecR family protein [Chitinophaga sp. HK235]|uniref:FecR family protein n=1 Tax=Chitinophaga sp. HK235 TaxID=2952571 RepID=UPI001BA8779B|nr:FecR domain-containing protein [Chitinophaga sp. HK235]